MTVGEWITMAMGFSIGWLLGAVVWSFAAERVLDWALVTGPGRGSVARDDQ